MAEASHELRWPRQEERRAPGDGPLLDDLPESDLGDCAHTMRRLCELPIRVVHGGHEPSFGRERMIEIADDWLARRA